MLEIGRNWGRGGVAATIYQNIAELGGRKGLPGAAVSCQKVAETGEGEGLAEYAVSCHKMA